MSHTRNYPNEETVLLYREMYKRNITHVKKYHKEHDPHPTEPSENLDMNRDRDDDVGPTTPNIDDRATERVKLRPTRMTILPSRFDDFVMT